MSAPKSELGYLHVDMIVMQKIVTSLQSMILEDERKILEAGQVSNYVYLIHQGNVNIIDPTGLFCIANLTTSSYFGEF